MNCYYKVPQQQAERALLVVFGVRNVNEVHTAFHQNQGQHAGQQTKPRHMLHPFLSWFVVPRDCFGLGLGGATSIARMS